MPNMTTATHSEYAGPVEVSGEFEPFDDIADALGYDPFRKCIITLLGDEASLAYWLKEEKRFVQHDRLFDVEVVEETDDRLVLAGKSRKLVDEVRMPPDQATVRWTMKVLGCPGC